MIVSSERGSPAYVYIISVIAAFGGLLYGFVLGVISGAMPFVEKDFGLSAYQVGFAVGNIDIGCLVGALAAGSLSDRYGRKRILILTAFLFALSGGLCAGANSFTELVAGRLIGGFAVGASMISALYTAEVAPARIRGFLVTLTQFGIVIGILATYVVNWTLAESGPGNWRWMFAAGMLPSAVFLAGLLFVPESPRWLAVRGETERARAILARIGGPSYAESELALIRAAVETEQGSVRELFQKGLSTALLIGVVVSILAQSVGINTVIYYAPTIFLKAGYHDASSAFLATVVVGAVNFLFTIVAILTIDRFGRKPLLLAGLAGMLAALVSTGILFSASSVSSVWVLAPILGFVALYAMSLGPIAWVLVSEIFPNRIRGVAMAICMSALYVSDFIVSLTFPRLMETMGYRVFFVYAAVCAAGFLFVLFVVSETKGKTLEEIEAMWKSAVSN